MATNERSMEEFQAVHNIILETLRVRLWPPCPWFCLGHEAVPLPATLRKE